MIAAARIERGVTMRASIIARPIFADGHFIPASAAEHRGLVPLLLRPDLDRMAGQSLVTLLAGVIDSTALHFDGDDVERGPIVSAAGLRIQIDSANFGARALHR